jgi:predicted nucleotidyltransferase
VLLWHVKLVFYLASNFIPLEALSAMSANLEIDSLIESLTKENPDIVVVLFGSRARNQAKKYSDYDLGVFREKAFAFQEFSRMLDRACAWNDANMSTVQIVNLTSAQHEFLCAISPDIKYLCGNTAAWIKLQQLVGVTGNEK